MVTGLDVGRLELLAERMLRSTTTSAGQAVLNFVRVNAHLPGFTNPKLDDVERIPSPPELRPLRNTDGRTWPGGRLLRHLGRQNHASSRRITAPRGRDGATATWSSWGARIHRVERLPAPCSCATEHTVNAGRSGE